MEKFKATLRKRLQSLATFMAGLAMLAVLGLQRPSAGATEEVRAFMTGLNAGLFAVAMVVAAVTAIQYIRALKNEGKCRALYISETDERLLYIRSKMGGEAIQLVLYGLVVATFAAEFFDQTVFFTLLGALLFTAAVKAIFKIVYTKKLT